MAIALVKVGAISTGTTSVTPAFGQATTAGNLLVAVVGTGGTTNGLISCGDATWLQAVTGGNVGTGGHPNASIFYKPNCGAGETAPAFSTSAGSPAIAAALAEYSGAATVSVLDKTGFDQSAGNAPACVGNDITTSDLAVSCFGIAISKSATTTFSHSWTPTGGAAADLVNNGSTKSSFSLDSAYYLLNTHGGGAADTDTNTITPSTGTATPVAVIASFSPPSPAMPPLPFNVDFAVARSTSY